MSPYLLLLAIPLFACHAMEPSNTNASTFDNSLSNTQNSAPYTEEKSCIFDPSFERQSEECTMYMSFSSTPRLVHSQPLLNTKTSFAVDTKASKATSVGKQAMQPAKELSKNPYLKGKNPDTYIQWVADLSLLWGNTTTMIHAKEHEALSKINSMLKVLRGFQYNYPGESKENYKHQGLTPDTKNFVLPYVSFVIRNDKGTIYLPGGYLQDSKGNALAFSSGKDASDLLESAFNCIVKAQADPSIHIMGGNAIQKLAVTIPTDAHSEVFLNAFVKFQPDCILTPLRKAKEKHLQSFPSAIFQIEAVVLDMHSWLDLCLDCKDNYKFLQQWKKTLETLTPAIHALESADTNDTFLRPIQTLVRIASETCYCKGTYGKGPSDDSERYPLDIGKDALSTTSEEMIDHGIILATRRPSNHKAFRDSLLNCLYQRHIQACTLKPYTFWTDNPQAFAWIYNLQHSLRGELLSIGSMVHRRMPFILAMRYSPNDVYDLSLEQYTAFKPLLKEILALFEEKKIDASERVLLSFLSDHDEKRKKYKVWHANAYIQHYAKAFYGYTVVATLPENSLPQEAWRTVLIDFIDYGLIEKINKDDTTTTQMLLTEIKHRKKQYEEYRTPEQYQKENIQAFENAFPKHAT